MEPGDTTAPVVFLLCARPPVRGASDVDLETYRTGDRSVLPVFSSLDALVDGCGERQPWIAVPIELLGERRRCAADEILWDGSGE